jgi:hypothetical protein
MFGFETQTFKTLGEQLEALKRTNHPPNVCDVRWDMIRTLRNSDRGRNGQNGWKEKKDVTEAK